MVSITAFILTFFSKVNISLFIVSSLFLCQTVPFRDNFKALFLFVLWIKTPHLIVISSDLLIQLWFYCRTLLTINISCCSLHQKMQTQICIVSLIRIDLVNSTINKVKEDTGLTILSSLRCTMIRLQISMTCSMTMKMTTIATVSVSRKMIEQTTSLTRTELSLKPIKKLQKSVRMLTSIMQ